MQALHLYISIHKYMGEKYELEKIIWNREQPYEKPPYELHIIIDQTEKTINSQIYIQGNNNIEWKDIQKETKWENVWTDIQIMYSIYVNKEIKWSAISNKRNIPIQKTNGKKATQIWIDIMHNNLHAYDTYHVVAK